MAYKDVLIPVLEKWGDRVSKYSPSSMKYNHQKYTSAMLVYNMLNMKTPEEAFQILKNIRSETEQVPVSGRDIDIHLIDEGIEDAKKLMNYHNKFRKVSTKKRAYINADDREDKFRQSLMVMTDDQLYAECKRYIKLSAYAMNNSSSAYHTRVTNCFDECERRGKRQLYHEAYSEVHSELFGKGRKTTVKKPIKKTTKRRKK